MIAFYLYQSIHHPVSLLILLGLDPLISVLWLFVIYTGISCFLRYQPASCCTLLKGASVDEARDFLSSTKVICFKSCHMLVL